MSTFETRNLASGYRQRPVLQSLSIRPIQPGCVTAILGPNGSGKSTLLKTVAGLIKPAAGTAMLGTTELTHLSYAERAQLMAYLPQSLPSAVPLCVLESILVAAHASLPSPAGRATSPGNAMDLLASLGIADTALQPLDQLSGGQRQLVGLAQALIRRPRLLLLDEPISALDLNHQWHVMDLLARETRDRGLITLVVLHDLNTALQHCSRAILIQAGQAICQGSPAEVITPRRLAAAYGVAARVECCSQGVPYVVVDGLCPLDR
ncbi:MAG TPA: ABC transporter ATP-binding protein [Castellaniella sp.]|uniref:ABC transporter ATP-binding protein n=1 Tax=Castellaniella sp. TaxID=1955812 RepID=UPI002EF6988C